MSEQPVVGVISRTKLEQAHALVSDLINRGYRVEVLAFEASDDRASPIRAGSLIGLFHTRTDLGFVPKETLNDFVGPAYALTLFAQGKLPDYPRIEVWQLVPDPAEQRLQFLNAHFPSLKPAGTEQPVPDQEQAKDKKRRPFLTWGLGLGCLLAIIGLVVLSTRSEPSQACKDKIAACYSLRPAPCQEELGAGAKSATGSACDDQQMDAFKQCTLEAAGSCTTGPRDQRD